MSAPSLGKIVAGQTRPTRNEILLGMCQSVDWANLIAQVTLPGASAPIPAHMAGPAPIVGQPVWVSLVGDLAVTQGRPSQPSLATVQGDPDEGVVMVLADDGATYEVGFSPAYTPADGHRVLLNWEAGGHIVIRIDVEVAPVAPPTDQVLPTARSKTFNPIDSGSYRPGGWQTGSVYFGSSFPSAGYFHGTQIADTIPDSATITGIRVYLEVIQAGGQSTMPLSLHGAASRPGGSLDLSDTINIGAMPAGFRGNVELPLAWGELLKTGQRRGVGTSGPGLRVLKGTNALAAAGAITIDWKE